ncbi:MAG: hypothetical protein JSR82_14770 [Verrucomicrobia bacterium]|nr:hypothetical protein [Verrucomicrobiota bacterium]
MIEISRYFAIPFSSSEISAEELRNFTEDHLARLGALGADSPRKAVAERLRNAGQSAFAAFDDALTERAKALAAQEGGTLGKDDVVRLFKTTIRQREGRIRDVFGKDSAAYKEFFPRGLTEYTQVTVGRVQTLLDRVTAAGEKHAAQLGAELATEFKRLSDGFRAARGGQTDATGIVAGARSKVAATRTALERQLTVHLLTLALEHLGEPERAADYFRQSLLEDPARQEEAAPEAAA